MREKICKGIWEIRKGMRGEERLVQIEEQEVGRSRELWRMSSRRQGEKDQETPALTLECGISPCDAEGVGSAWL